MRVLSHRGWWGTAAEKNSPAAFKRSFEAGYGTETDLRDALGKLVISHDPPGDPLLAARELLEIYNAAGGKLPLALNIKADGLQKLVRAALDDFGVTDYFLFDMSLPDALQSIRAGLRVYSRQSEYEPEPLFYAQAAGVWLDCFHGEWFDAGTIRRHLDAGKEVCVVSPDLHRREPRALWETLARTDLARAEGFSICTDLPDQAQAVFNG